MNSADTYNKTILDSVMIASIKTNPASILITPRLVSDGNHVVWEGVSDIRCKGCGDAVESKEFIISVLESVINHLQDS